MKLLFDLQATQSSILGAGGGGEYARAVFRRLMAHPSRTQLVGCLRRGHQLDPDIEALVRQYAVELVSVADLGELQTLIHRGQYAGFMSPMPYLYHAHDFSGMDVFFTVHGLRPLEERIPFHARHYALGVAEWAKWAAKFSLELLRPNWRRAQFQGLLDVPCRQLNIIVPSCHTRISLLEKLRIPADVRIHELYSPETQVSRERELDDTVLDQLGVNPGRYLLMVSGNRWIKNAWHGLRAVTAVMAKLPAERRLPVIVTGGIPRGLSRSQQQHVIPTGYLSAAELAALYRGARALFYPTLNEGFGYPPLEAMARGTPVVCSSISAVTEIVGDAGIYFDPHREDEMKVRLRLIMEEDAVLADYARRGQQRFAEVRARQERDLNTLCELFYAIPERP